jgi:hypothetical protein
MPVLERGKQGAKKGRRKNEQEEGVAGVLGGVYPRDL